MKRFNVRDRETGEVGYRTDYFVIALLAAIWLTLKDKFKGKKV